MIFAALAFHSAHEIIGVHVPEYLDQIVGPIIMTTLAIPAGDAHQHDPASVEPGERIIVFLRPIWFRHDENGMGTFSLPVKMDYEIHAITSED